MISPIQLAIMDTYHRSLVAFPTPKHCIVPLHCLLGAYDITYTELSELTSEHVSTFLLRRGAIMEPLSSCSQDPLAGFIVVQQTSGHLFVEHNDSVVRRRFSMAHELGHYLLHFRPWFDHASSDEQHLVLLGEQLPIQANDEFPTGTVFAFAMSNAPSPGPFSLPPGWQMEREANQFAAELLMPSSLVRELLASFEASCLGDDLVWRMATDLLVSSTAMRIRLRELHLRSAVVAPLN